MNIVEILNSYGKTFVDFAWPMLIQSSALILAMLLVDWGIRKRVRAVVRYCFWMLILVKLVLPTSLTSPTGVGYWVSIDHSQPMEETPLVVANDQLLANETSSQDITEPVETPAMVAAEEKTVPTTPVVSPAAQMPTIDWRAMIFVGWLIVAGGMTLLVLQRYGFVRGLIRQGSDADEKTKAIFDECCAQMKIAKPPIVKMSSAMVSPAACGLLRPVVIIPEMMATKLSEQELRAVLLHELAHIRRSDLWINCVQTLLQVIYFYNPLLWLANGVIRRIREQAVDETVLVTLRDDAKQYPETLLTVATLALARPALSLRLVGVVESKSALASRIRHMLSRPFPTSAKLGGLGLTGIVVIAALLLPMAKGEQKSNNEPQTQEKMVGTTQPTAEKPSTSKNDGAFKATFSNGVTVEIMGVSYHPSKGKQWWRADGAKLEQAPYDRLSGEGKVYPQKDDKAREIALRLDSIKSEDVSYCAQTIFSHGGSATGSCNVQDNSGKEIENLKAIAMIVPEKQDTITIRYGMAVGKWQILANYFGEGISGSSQKEGGVYFTEPYEKDKEVILSISTDIENIGNVETRLIAIDEKGNIHVASSNNSVGTSKSTLTTYRFLAIRKKQIKEYQFQTRPYEWIEFKNISLEPGVKTNVEIVGGRDEKKMVGTALPAQEQTTIDESKARAGIEAVLKQFWQAAERKDLNGMLEVADGHRMGQKLEEAYNNGVEDLRSTREMGLDVTKFSMLIIDRNLAVTGENILGKDFVYVNVLEQRPKSLRWVLLGVDSTPLKNFSNYLSQYRKWSEETQREFGMNGMLSTMASLPQGITYRQLHFVRVVVGKDQTTFEGQPVPPDVHLVNYFGNVKDRPNTVLEYAVDNDNLTLKEFKKIEKNIFDTAMGCGNDFAYLSNVGVHSLGEKGSPEKYIAVGQFAFGKTIPVHLSSYERSGMFSDVDVKRSGLFINDIRFVKKQDRFAADFSLVVSSWPKAEWEIQLRLIDKANKSFYEEWTHVTATGWNTPEPYIQKLTGSFFPLPNDTASRAATFEISITQKNTNKQNKTVGTAHPTTEVASGIYLVRFSGKNGFSPKDARDLLDAFNENYPRGIRTHHYSAKSVDGNLVGSIYVDGDDGRDAVKSMLEKNEKLSIIEIRPVNVSELTSFLVVFKSAAPLKNGTPEELLEAFNAGPLPGINTYFFQTQVQGSDLIGYIMADAKEGKDSLAAKLAENKRITVVEIRPGDLQATKKIKQMKQVSLPTTVESKENSESQELLAKVAKIDVGRAKKEDVIAVFGEPGAYLRGQQELDKKKLPSNYVMNYPNGFQVFISGGDVNELRFEEPGPFVHPSGLRVGMAMDEAVAILGQPKNVVQGKANQFADGVLYKDIDGKEGWGYYGQQDKGVRMFFTNGEVSALYLTGTLKQIKTKQIKESSTSLGESNSGNNGKPESEVQNTQPAPKGLQLQLDADAESWSINEKPKFQLGVCNAGPDAKSCKRTMNGFQLCVDGKEYRYAVKVSSSDVTLNAGEKVENVRIVLSKYWRSESENKPLSLEIGKHTVQIVLLADGESSAKSNTVTFEITEKPVPKMQARAKSKDGSLQPEVNVDDTTIYPGVGLQNVHPGDSRSDVKKGLGEPSSERTFPNGGHTLIYEPRAMDCFLRDDTVREIHFNQGYQGSTTNGIRIGSSLDEVLKTCGGANKTVEGGQEKRNGAPNGGDHVLYKIKDDHSGQLTAYRFFDEKEGMLYWLNASGYVSQIVVYRPQNVEIKDPPTPITYIIRFKAAAGERVTMAAELLKLFNLQHPGQARTHHFRTEVVKDELVGLICADSISGDAALKRELRRNEKITLVSVRSANSSMLRKLYAMGQVSLDPNQSDTKKQAKSSTTQAVDKKLGWGESVEGVQLRLRTKKQTWNDHEIPVLFVDARNNGSLNLRIRRESDNFKLMVDGEEYHSIVDTTSFPSQFGPGIEYDDIKISIGKEWRKKDLGELSLSLQQHTIQAIWDASAEDGRTLRVTTLPVKIGYVDFEKNESTSQPATQPVGKSGEFKLNEVLTVGVREPSLGLMIRSVQFTARENLYEAAVDVSYPSGPKTKWNVELALFDAEEHSVASLTGTIENSGAIISGRATTEHQKFNFHIIPPVGSVPVRYTISASAVSREQFAVDEAEKWLKLVDDENYDKSWETAAEYFRNALTEEKWDESMKSVREPLGVVISRNVISKEYATSLPGAPDGEYVVIQFQTSFENKKQAVETVTPMKDKDGVWRVSGYYIK
jgi:beta-lactamase regulating signal transducer with metallopeptidase domain